MTYRPAKQQHGEGSIESPMQQTLPQHQQASLSPHRHRHELHNADDEDWHTATKNRMTTTSCIDDSEDGQSQNSNDSSHSQSTPTSRTAILAFLFLGGIAIVHAIASGFDNMHSTSNQRSPPDNNFGNSFVDETDDAVSFSSSNTNLANNEVIYEKRNKERSVTSDGNAIIEEGNTNEAAATILTRASQLASLISHLDASDVVECYVVTRMAHLNNVASSSSSGSGSGGNNNSRRIQQKMLDESSMEQSGSYDTSFGGEETKASATSASNVPSGPVLIRKSALAFRYRPRSAAASASRGPHFSSEQILSEIPDQDLTPADMLEKQKYFELILEYGPERSGAAKISESMPMVRLDSESGGMGSKYVSWENQGRVYYSNYISSEWTGAYYMAPITGVVMEKIIQHAVEYTYKRPRYQPFEVVSKPSGNLIVKSSGSDDFVWQMFRDLADLYVDIDPLLVPPRGRVQFYVADPEDEEGDDEAGRRDEGDVDNNGDISNKPKKQRQPNPNVNRVKGAVEGSHAAMFFENFFNCANAIKTGDYSLYLPPETSSPSVSPTVSLAPTAAPTNIATEKETNATEEDEADSTEDSAKKAKKTQTAVDNEEANKDFDLEANSEIEQGEDEIIYNSTATTTSEDSDDATNGESKASEDELENDQLNSTGHIRHRYLSWNGQLSRSRRQLDDEILTNSTDDAVLSNVTLEANSEDAPSSIEDLPEGLALDGDDDFLDSNDQGDVEPSEDDPAEIAEKAAIEAEIAAENAAAAIAANTDDSKNNTAADAADIVAATTEAAKAAKKAKEASTASRSKISAEALLSGNGELMTSVLAHCFSDPKYGIRKQELIEVENGNNLAEGSDEDDNAESATQTRDLTHAYIYLDGDIFFRLNLTPPYWGTVSVAETVPPPHVPLEGKGDAVDWAIFILILTGTLFGFVVTGHQIGFVIDKRLRFRYIFHPTMSESDWASEEDESMEGGDEQSPLKPVGGGFAHSELRMTVESIPTSMGGKRGGPPTQQYLDRPESSSLLEESEDHNGLDLEMAKLQSPCQSSSTPKSRERKMSYGDDGTPNNSSIPGSLRLKMLSPDEVQRPDARSFSKVAMPKTSPRTTDANFRRMEMKKGDGPPTLPIHE